MKYFLWYILLSQCLIGTSSSAAPSMVVDELFAPTRYPFTTVKINCTETCGTKVCDPPVPPPPPNNDLTALLISVLTSAYGTAETMLRSFALGFGCRMIKFALVENEEDLAQLRERILKSAVVGLSVASVVLGLSLLVPVEFRVHWFDYS